jgi:threonine/homoserine/homoserine lactone efflux protein
MSEVLVFLLQAVVISLSGVMAPGAVTAATLAAGTRSRHAGSLIAVGHGIVELPLMLLIVAGAGAVFEIPAVRIGIGLAGGAFMLWMGGQMALAVRRPAEQPGGSAARGPVVTGIVLSASNPYFLLWWATVGLALTTQAYQLGAMAFALFAAVHWLCDLAWLEVLSQASFRGTRLLKGRTQQLVLGICAAAMLLFGARFVCLAVLSWLGGGG